MRKLFGILLLLAASSSYADTIYTITTGNYVNVSGIYTTAMHLEGSFTTASPLPANFSGQIGPGGADLVKTWSFTDGFNTLNQLNSILLYDDSSYFTVTTDASGALSSVNIGFMSPTPPNAVSDPMDAIYLGGDPTSMIVQAVSDSPCSSVTGSACDSIGFGTDYVSDAGNTATFSAMAAPVPTMPQLALALLGALLAAIGATRLAVGRRDRLN